MYKKILPLSALIILDALFLGVGMSFGEKIHIVIIDCILALFLVSILMLFKLFFEAIILRIVAYLSKCTITMRNIASVLLASLTPAVLIMILGNLLQLILFKSENDIFQIIMLTASQTSFFIISLKKFMKLGEYKVLNISWIMYNAIFICIEIISVLNLLSN